ncbi:LMBR1 domain-containing protein 2 homolog [Cimex lectularius]|uniref:LMBR1 domain-containing protein 2 homolog n=1 Tax=Cimex lectularius TaxID=79782 RepID=A0A8I6TFH0_CIMLE|nr:LMBR1 domain-containing protein 2 homolog [Cimex lectularius]
MTAGPLIAEVVFVFCLAVGILYKYGNLKKQNAFVTFAVLIAWYFSFLIIFVLPLDVSSTVYRQCLNNLNTTGNSTNKTVCKVPWSYVPDYVLPNLWRVVYWSSEVLTWLVLPLMQSYAKAGEFTIRGKLKSALVDNAIYYGSYLFICGILLIYIAVKPDLQLDGQKIKAIASSASNTWGLLLLVGLLGYALVEIPRSLWLSTTPGYCLQRAYFKVAKISADKCEADETLDDILESIQSMASSVQSRDPLYSELETVLRKIPPHLLRQTKLQSAAAHADSMVAPTLKSLVRIHKQLIKSLHTSKRCETQWKLAVEKVILLEDVQRNKMSNDKTFKHTFDNTPALISPAFEWYWRCLIQDYVFKVAAVVCAILSAMVVWSEVTFFNKSPVLSLFAVFLNLARNSYDYFSIEILSTVIIAYLCFCAYSTVLKIRVLNYYYLAPHHQTDEHSLIFSGMMLCRLTPPMCLNFLGLIHLDSHIIQEQLMETQYTQVMGHMVVVSIISDGFNIYFPMMVLAFCLATYFSLGSRLLSLIGFQQFLEDSELTTELMEEGRDLVNREKRKRQRKKETEERRREYNERFGISCPVVADDTVINTGLLTDSSSRSNLLTAAEPIAYYQTESRADFGVGDSNGRGDLWKYFDN